MRKISKSQNSKDLTTGPIGRGLLAFAIPLFLGQLLQQLYNVADAWVVGNFANNNAFAAVSSTGSMIFLIIGFFHGCRGQGGAYQLPVRHYCFGGGNRAGTAFSSLAAPGHEDTRRGYAGCPDVSADLFRRRFYYYYI